jgi:prepilin-type N-terminal cleavage/methylation domain-containing protein
MNRPARAGFTLVEVLLTLALAVVLITLVGSAMSFYANNLQTRDSEVRRGQLASAILQMIRRDLNATLHPPEFDGTALANALGSSSGGGSRSGEGDAGDDAASDSALFDQADEGASDGSSLEEDADLGVTADLATNGLTLQRPGLIGNQFQVQFDISRLPRLEEYQQLLTSAQDGLADVPSDIKTVTYYVQAAGSTGVIDPLAGVSDPDASPLALGSSAGGGLVRRQLDRQVTRYALDSGNMTSVNLAGDLLAPEIVALEFAYFDGLQWRTEWNSDTYGGLPMAVQVKLTMTAMGVAASDVDVTASDQVRVFRQTIRLPMAQPLEQDDEMGMATESLTTEGSE